VRARWLQVRLRTSLMANMALTAFMLCMMMKVSDVGSGTVLSRIRIALLSWYLSLRTGKYHGLW
jgi:hypothetical protein